MNVVGIKVGGESKRVYYLDRPEWCISVLRSVANGIINECQWQSAKVKIDDIVGENRDGWWQSGAGRRSS
jgi:hypothetical protein